MKLNKEDLSLTFFITNTLFFGTIFSKMFHIAGNDSIPSFFIGTIIGLLIILLINKININNIYSKIVLLLIYLFFLILSITTIEIYISSFLLTKTPKIIFILPAIAVCFYGASRCDSTLKNASFIFFFISIISFAFIFFMLANYLSIDNVTPFFIHKPLNILKASLTFGIFSAMPNILLKKEQIPIKKHLLYYLFSVFLNIIMGIFTLSVLTPEVAAIYSYPEYMVLKRIRLFSFIENIENFCILAWYFNYFFFIVYIFKGIKSLLQNKTAYIFLTISAVIITTFIFANNYIMTLYLYNNSLIISIILLCLIMPALIKSNEKYK